jgi:hypothetical protein
VGRAGTRSTRPWPGATGPDTLELWVDGSGRLVRLTRSTSDAVNGRRGTTLELYDFGVTLAVARPPAIS